MTRRLALLSCLISALLLFTSPAHAATYNVNSQAALNSAITAANAALDEDTINITANITLTGDLLTIFGVTIINGNGYTINGGGQHTAITLGGSSGNVTIKNLTLAQNKGATSYHGGAIMYPGGVSLTLDNVTIRNSSTSASDANGGGLYCNGPSLTIRNSRIHDNSGNNGGGIYLDSSCTGARIINSSIYDNNSSTGNGGGIHVATGASVTISNSSIYGNSSAHRGGGMYIAGGTVTLNHVTIVGNTTTNAQGSASSETGAGIRAFGGTLNLRNSIIFGNTFQSSAENCRIASSATAGTLSHNIVGGGSDASCTANSDAADPNLAGPSVHGQGKFFIPRPGSPAIDSADCLSSVTTDQRRRTRPNPASRDGKCDKGAIEWYAPPAPRSDDSDQPSGSSSAGSSDQAAPAALSTCFTLEGLTAFNINPQTQCQRINALQIANPAIKDGDFVDAVDVWAWVTPASRICFEAAGSAFTFIDTAAMPRSARQLAAFLQDGYTCTDIDGPGMLILLPGDPPAAAASSQPVNRRALSNCMVTANADLHLRDAPAGAAIGGVSKGWKLTAMQRTDYWFQVDRLGVTGWIFKDYVTADGDCD